MAIPGSSSTPAIDNIEPAAAAEKKLKDHAAAVCALQAAQY